MSSDLFSCVETNFDDTSVSTNSKDCITPSVVKPELSSAPLVYYNNHGEPIVDFTLELEKMRNCLGKIALQRRTFERRGSVDSVNTCLSGSEDNSDSEENDSTKRRILPTNVSFLLRELDDCLENFRKCREYDNKKANKKENNKTKVGNEIETKSRNIWPSQESIAKVSARFATSFKSAVFEPSTNPTPTASQKLPNYIQRQPVTLSEVYIAALWAGWVSKLYITNPLFVTRKTWKRRFFVLTPKALYRFKSSAPSAVSLEPIEISATTVANVSEKFPARQWVVEINNAGRSTCYIQVESLEELKIWLSNIKSAIIQNRYPSHQLPSKTARDSTTTSSTISSISSSNQGKFTPRLAEVDSTQIPAQVPMPKYPPPPVPTTKEHSLQRIPSYGTSVVAFRPALQRVKTFPGKGILQPNHSSTSKLLIIEPNPTQIINTIPRNNLTFSAVEAMH